MKYCKKCQTDLPHSAFFVDRKRPDGLYPMCKACYKVANPPEHTNITRRLSKVGITRKTYEATKKAQGELCAICLEPMTGLRFEHLDHDHKTGVFRGILCRRCNHGLGNFRDDPALLQAAIDYLASNRSTKRRLKRKGK